MCPIECPRVFIGKYIPLWKYRYLLQTNILGIIFIPLPKFHFVINSPLENYLMKQYHLSSGIFFVCDALTPDKLSYFKHQVSFSFLPGVKETVKEIGINIP